MAGTQQMYVAGTPTLAGIGGLLSIQAGPVVTAADTDPHVLFTYTLPPNVMGSGGTAIRISASGVMANGSDDKTLILSFGSVDMPYIVAGGLKDLWAYHVDIGGTAAAQTLDGAVDIAAAATPADRFLFAGLPTEDNTSPIVIKLTGQNGAATPDQITALQMKIEYLNAPV